MWRIRLYGSAQYEQVVISWTGYMKDNMKLSMGREYERKMVADWILSDEFYEKYVVVHEGQYECCDPLEVSRAINRGEHEQEA